MNKGVAGRLLHHVVEEQKESGSWMFLDGYIALAHQIDLEEADGALSATTEDRRWQYALRSIAYLCWRKGVTYGLRVAHPDSIYVAERAALQEQLLEFRLLVGEKAVLRKLHHKKSVQVDPLFAKQLIQLGDALGHLVLAVSAPDSERSLRLLARTLTALRLPPDLTIKLVGKVMSIK